MDKFYVSSSILHLIKPQSCEIIPNPLADHNICKITLVAPNGEQYHKPSWKFNVRLLQSPGFKQDVINLIQNDQLLQLTETESNNTYFEKYGKLNYKLRKLSRSTAIGRSTNIKIKIDKVQRDIIDLEQELQTPLTKSELELKYRHLHKLHNSISFKYYTKASINRAEKFERSTRSFFSIAKPPKTKTRLSAVLKPDGTLSTTHAEIEETTCSFYEELFDFKETNFESQNTLLNTISTQIPNKLFRLMDQPITLDEVLYAIKTSGNNKSPGPNGFPAEFYKEFSSILAPILLKFTIVADMTYQSL